MGCGCQLLVTGASGFVGKALSLEAFERGFRVRAVSRSYLALPAAIECVAAGDIDGSTDWIDVLKGCDVVVHLAARVHVMNETNADTLVAFRKVNVEGTLTLARCAVAAGVRRFVFVSSIKVNGEVTQPGQVFTADDVPAPEDAYGFSKAEAEAGLMQLAEETGMEVTIIRPPLVYGPGVKGNFYSLLVWVGRGLPLPLGCVTRNRRSLVALDNLVDLILICAEHPNAANQKFLVSDGEDLSTTELLRRIAKALKRPVRLLQVPTALLVAVGSLLGKREVVQRLLGSLQVDITKTCELLDWKPPVSVDEGLVRAAK